MLKLIDNFLNKTTMYRLVLYYLIFLLVAAVILSFFGLLPYSLISLVLSAIVITVVCWITNTVFAEVFGAPTNVESVYITALILTLIISPIQLSNQSWLDYFSFLGWAAILSMASKYILAIKKKHIFNPAAFAVALTAITISQSASWWVGNIYMVPFVLVGGLIVARKMLRFDLVFSFIIASLLTVLVFSFLKGGDLVNILTKTLFYSPILFFSFVMITEPLTTPPTKWRQICYGIFTGFLFAPAIHIGSIYSTPELALLSGNIFSYFASSKTKLILMLKQKIRIAPDIYDFVFSADQKLSFKPGQYLEWTLGHNHPDSRGNRRYFTIASSPTENEIKLGVKFYDESSSFKKSLLLMNPDSKIVASQLAGDFVMPKDKEKKLVFIAGGIGITPFRSMIKYLLDSNEQRSIILLYSNKTASDIAYSDIFEEAREKLGIKTVYTLTDLEKIPHNWNGQIGFVSEKMIKDEIPDYKERTFYISGPHSMVTVFEKTLSGMDIKKGQIKIDFFPGLV